MSAADSGSEIDWDADTDADTIFDDSSVLVPTLPNDASPYVSVIDPSTLKFLKGAEDYEKLMDICKSFVESNIKDYDKDRVAVYQFDGCGGIKVITSIHNTIRAVESYTSVVGCPSDCIPVCDIEDTEVLTADDAVSYLPEKIENSLSGRDSVIVHAQTAESLDPPVIVSDNHTDRGNRLSNFLLSLDQGHDGTGNMYYDSSNRMPEVSTQDASENRQPANPYDKDLSEATPEQWEEIFKAANEAAEVFGQSQNASENRHPTTLNDFAIIQRAEMEDVLRRVRAVDSSLTSLTEAYQEFARAALQ